MEAVRSTDLGVWFTPDSLRSAEIRVFAQRVEALGYSKLWFGEAFGRDPFAQLSFLGQHTNKLELATGIANIYHRHPGIMLQGANTVAEQTDGRITLGLGVSSPVIVSKMRGINYDKPLTFMREYLNKMQNSRYTSIAPTDPVPIVLAALGPKMLELAAERTAGAHPYNVTPEHTSMARSVMGPNAGLFVEQKVILTQNPQNARALASQVLAFYSRSPGYRNAWKQLGFTDEDIDAPSNRWLDAIVVWGDPDTIKARITEHTEAGATHVCIQPLHPEYGMKQVDYSVLEALQPTKPTSNRNNQDATAHN